MSQPQSSLAREIARKVQATLEEAGVFWLYPGKPRKEAPHALLTSGLHSDGYVNVGQVLKDRPEIRGVFASAIIEALLPNVTIQAVQWSSTRVVGADTSSTDLAEAVALLTGAIHTKMIKTEDERGKRQVWHPDNLSLRDGDVVLHLEELITTSSSALQVREGIRLANPGVKFSFSPFLPVVVERSDPDNRVIQVEDSKVLPLLQLAIRNFKPGPETCPYCAAGSEALKPKHGDNWAKLTGKIENATT
ncbi:MAG: hypothetical protein Q8M83_00700 [bacterium]|nr:hypothetical protein [bacterium]